MSLKSRMFWYVRAMPSSTMSCGPRPTMLVPLNSMVPAVGGIMPVSWLKNVVLPAPFGPMIDTIARRGMSKSMFRLASSPPNFLLSPRTTRIAPRVGSSAS